jgi:hypothetical protein
VEGISARRSDGGRGNSDGEERGKTMRKYAIASGLAVAAIVMTGCGGSSKTSVTDAKLDALDLWKDVAIYYVDYDGTIDIGYRDGSYTLEASTGYLEDSTLDARIGDPQVSIAIVNSESWCIVIRYNGGSDAVHVDQGGGPEVGDSC